ncbi:MAG: GNAT family N-acetyltransferase [Patescibacteria group bacterium]
MIKNNIKLRKIKKSDLPYFLKWWKDKDLIKVTSGRYKKDNGILRGYFMNMLKSNKDHHFIIIFNRKLIGNVSLTDRGKGIFEIHIVIGEKQYQGKGIGTIAIKKVLNIAFNKLKYSKAYLEVRPDNERAIRAYKNCGLKEKGIKKYPKNKFMPVVLKMTLNKKDFS